MVFLGARVPRAVKILGARGPPRPSSEMLAAVQRVGSSSSIQLLDARFVLGHSHLVSAAEHASRAMRQGTNVARTLPVEFVLYASGERQIAQALEKMGLREDTETFAVVLFDDADPDSTLAALELSRDDSVLDPSLEKLRAFGLTDEEIASAPPDRMYDLVFERVASVDLAK